MLSEKLNKNLSPRDYHIDDFLWDDSFLSLFRSEFWKDTNTASKVLTKLMNYSNITDEEYFFAKSLIWAWRIRKIFINFWKWLKENWHSSQINLETYWEWIETMLPLCTFRLKLHQIYEDDQLLEKFVVVSQHEFKWSSWLLYAPIQWEADFYIIHIPENWEVITWDWTIEGTNDTYIIFNHTSEEVTYVYSIKTWIFSIIQWSFVANRQWIPKNIIEVWNWLSTVFIDLESDLYYRKTHTSQYDTVQKVFETSEDNIVLHTVAHIEVSNGRKSIWANWVPVESQKLLIEDKLHSMVEWRDIFSYNGKIIDFFSVTNGSTYVVCRKEVEKVLEVIDLETWEVIDQISNDFIHHIFLSWWSELVILKYDRRGVEITFSWTNEVIRWVNNVTDIHYYSLDWIHYSAFTVELKNWTTQNYTLRNEEWRTILEEEIIYHDKKSKVKSEFLPWLWWNKQDTLKIPDNLSWLIDNTALATYTSIFWLMIYAKDSTQSDLLPWLWWDNKNSISLPDNLSWIQVINSFKNTTSTNWVQALKSNKELEDIEESTINTSDLIFHSYWEKLQAHYRMIRFLKKINSWVEKIWLWETKRIISELNTWPDSLELYLAIADVISKTWHAKELSKYLSELWIWIVYCNSEFKEHSKEFILIKNKLCIHSNFWDISDLTVFDLQWWNKWEACIGVVSTTSGNFFIRVNGNTFTYCYINESENSKLKFGWKEFNTVENPNWWFDLLLKSEGIVYSLWIFWVVSDQEKLDKYFDTANDGVIRKQRVALYIDREHEHFILFDWYTFWEVRKHPDRDYSKNRQLDQWTLTKLH